jgi:hypothetical protein
VKRVPPAMACAFVLVATLAACGGGAEKSGLPTFTAGSSPSTAPTSRPTSTAPTKETAALAAHSTYTYDGLSFVVNLPADLPKASRPNIRLFSEFLKSDGRTSSRNKLDPAMAKLASAEVVKQTPIDPGSVAGIGAVTYTVNKVQSSTSGRFTVITGCLDQSKLVQVRKDGSRFVDANTKEHPTLKMSANVGPGLGGPQVTLFTFAAGSC